MLHASRNITLQLINPKAYALATTFFTGFPIWPDNYPAEVTAKVVILSVIW